MNSLLQKKFERLENLKAEMLKDIFSMPDGIANQAPQEGKWSAVQTAMHIYDAELNGLKYMQKKLNAGDALRKSGFKGNFRTFLLRTAMKMKIRFKAPDIIAHPDNKRSPQELKKDWTGLRMEMVSFLNTVPEKYHERYIFKHPIAGKINLYQALDFMADHLERHALQVKKITKLNA